MDTHSTNRRAIARGHSEKRGRSCTASFRLITSVFAMAFCSVPTAAIAAEVVDMRLGRHPAYTRVVFELSGPAGYRLEQDTREGGNTELVVTLDASAHDQEKSLRNSLVQGVSLTGDGAKSIARIQLRGEGLRVKEMLLGSPARIVLDVLAPAAATVGKVAAKPASKASPPSPPSPRSASTLATAPTHSIAQRNGLKPASLQPVASISRSAPSKPSRITTRPAPTPAARPPSGPQAPRASVSTSVAPKPAAAKPAPAKVASTPPPPARKKLSLPAAPAAIPQSSSDSLLTPVSMGGLALLGLVGGGAFFMMRRRSGDEPGTDDVEADSEENPFDSLSDELTVAAEPETGNDEASEIPMATHVDDSFADDSNVVDEFASGVEEASYAENDSDADIPVAKVAADSGPEEDLFETSMTESLSVDSYKETGTVSEAAQSTAMLGSQPAEAGGENMDTFTDTGMDSGVDAGMPPMAGASDNSEVMRMLREFEQRVSSLESKLEEVTEAKERLERQVAAQTDELRVQRAAIARTQRALRNLSRPDDESPTEPALREPNP
jgi:hypothetical protein